MVSQYLSKYVAEENLPELYAAVLRKVSTQYRGVPDIAVFDEIIDEWPNKNARSAVVFDIKRYLPGPAETVSEAEARAGFEEILSKMRNKGKNDD